MSLWRLCNAFGRKEDNIARRLLHCQCSLLGPAEDPGYFGLFDPHQEQGKQPAQQESELAHDEAQTKLEQLHLAFRARIREWARKTPPEYMSRPPSRRRKPNSTTHDRKEAVKAAEPQEEEEEQKEEEEEEEEGDSDEDDDDDDSELDVIDDEDELDAIDREEEDTADKKEGEISYRGKRSHLSHNVGSDGEKKILHRKSSDEQHILDMEPEDDEEKERRRKLFSIDPQNDGRGDGDEQLYYFTEKGKLKYKPIHIIAPKDVIYQRLIQSGLVSSRLKRPLPVMKLVKKTDAEIVGWYYYCSIELLQFFRICHNLKEVKAIVEYHIRWSAIWTLARKYKCNPRDIVKKYGRDLECEDRKGKKIRLMTMQEIKDVSRGVNKRVQMHHRFLALNILDEMD